MNSQDVKRWGGKPLRLIFQLSLCCLMYLSSEMVTAASSKQAGIATAHPLATQAGVDILEQGGNAFDAAVAVSAVLAVVEPYGSGMGGGGFWLLHRASDGYETMLDGRETAPMDASRDMYLDKKGEPVEGASIVGALAAGIPGQAAALDWLSNNMGKLPLDKTLAPAIKWAEQGFPVNKHYQAMMRFRLEHMRQFPSSASIFLKRNDIPEEGDLIIQPDLAIILRKIAKEGRDGFYKGEVAEKLVKGVRDNGGIWSRKDLEKYQVKLRKPVKTRFHNMSVTSAALPSSGGAVLSLVFQILQQYDFDDLTESQKIHLLTETQRRAYHQRAMYMGDPDFTDVPLEKLLSDDYAKKLAETISLSKATPSASLPPVFTEPQKGQDTTHFSIIDQEGNRVAATLSINYPFGSAFVPSGTGVLLNNEMDDFSIKPGQPNAYGLVGNQANAIEPEKRMLSSMTPTFLETPNRLAVMGTPGGSRIITAVMQGALDFYAGESAQTIVDTPRIHHQYLPDSLDIEPNGMDNDLQLDLEEYGHTITEKSYEWGDMQIVIQDKKTGKMEAASDRRGAGEAQVSPLL